MSRPTQTSSPFLRAAHVALCATLFATACTAVDVPIQPTAPSLSVGNPLNASSANPFTLAVIGDIPYGPAKLAEFPAFVDLINSDPKVDLVVHLGDIKAGKNDPCTDAYFATVRNLFDGFKNPLVYTPGDNEWTDCHVAFKNNGLYTPTERLQAIRALFFPVAGQTLGGRKMRVLTQADDAANSAYIENVMWIQSRVVFAALNVTGSNNDLAPWGSPLPANAGSYPSQPQEVAARAAANAAWLDKAFALATANDAAGVVLMLQADMWDSAEPSLSGYDAIVTQIGARAAAFGKPVLLLQGDSHQFEVQQPYSASSPLRLMHPNTPVAENVTRIVVEGSSGRTEYVRLTVDPKTKSGALFTWERVPLVTPTLSKLASANDDEPTLLARAILPSNAYQPGPPSGAFITADNGVTPPFPGQPIPGFSAVLAAKDGTFWAMPDNGYGAKTNSGDFLLRLYRVQPDFKTDKGGSGTVAVLDYLQLRDPGGKIPFALYRPDRLLTGADFDLESVRQDRNGDFWFGEEFGPFLLHTDASGKVLEAPIPLPGVQSPQNPFLLDPNAWTIRASRGFEPMALSVDGKTLYPMLEGALRNDPDIRRRIINEFDLRTKRYTGRTWQYRTDEASPGDVIGDMTALDEHRFVLIERDDFQGVQAQVKKIYLIDLRRVDAQGFLEKRLVLDLLRIADPNGISLPARPDEFGVGRVFSFPLQSVESLEVLGGERLLIANDNNYPFSDGRWIGRDKPDDTEMIIVRVPALR
ncbi:MAG: esterase-like activity of phytase family protein [Gemmatimonadaceae bacterium]